MQQNNQNFFNYINNSLIKKAHIDVAMEETSRFLNASASMNASNLYTVSEIETQKTDLGLLQSRLSQWQKTQAFTDSRTVETSLNKIYADFSDFVKTTAKLPEIGYNDFGNIPLKDPVGKPPVRLTWPAYIIGAFILSIFCVIAWNLWEAFMPKSDESLGNDVCWVKTGSAFAEITAEPQFVSTSKITTLPGNKKYRVLEIVSVGMNKKCYKIRDKKLNVEGWISENHLKEINQVCYSKNTGLEKKNASESGNDFQQQFDEMKKMINEKGSENNSNFEQFEKEFKQMHQQNMSGPDQEAFKKKFEEKQREIERQMHQ